MAARQRNCMLKRLFILVFYLIDNFLVKESVCEYNIGNYGFEDSLVKNFVSTSNNLWDTYTTTEFAGTCVGASYATKTVLRT